MANEPWIHPLKEPINLPDGRTLSELKFPRMKGKYMRKFRMRVERGDVERARSGDDVGTTMTIRWDDYMVIGTAMLEDEYGHVSAGIIFDEMGPEDVTEVVAKLGERFAGGQQTGTTA